MNGVRSLVHPLVAMRLLKLIDDARDGAFDVEVVVETHRGRVGRLTAAPPSPGSTVTDPGSVLRGEKRHASPYRRMDLTSITAIDRAFDRLLEAAAELREAERSARSAEQKRLASDAHLLARAVEAEADAAHGVIRRALLS